MNVIHYEFEEQYNLDIGTALFKRLIYENGVIKQQIKL
jgi:hypothetical protein